MHNISELKVASQCETTPKILKKRTVEKNVVNEIIAMSMRGFYCNYEAC